MNLYAKVSAFRNNVRHGEGRLQNGQPMLTNEFIYPESVSIEEEGGGYYLYRLDAGGNVISDTWHATLAEAKHQANFEYGIEDSHWLVGG